ncbi:MAG: hypothetical protein QM791_22585 [Ferruginibacter sp.]
MNTDPKTNQSKTITNNEDETDITPEEKALLDAAGENSEEGDDENLLRSMLDNTDDDGELLNEQSNADDLSGKDLDVPGAEDDDDNEDIGEEDEENNEYSRADQE